MIQVCRAPIEDILIINPKINNDSRGYFLESYKDSIFEQLGYSIRFVQDNQVKSFKGALRGLHYQLNSPQGKLVWVSQGSVLDVAVDIRTNSSTFSKYFSKILDDKNHTRLYIPPGFAHGYLVLSETSIFHYKCTNYYDPKDEYGILWEDPTVGIEWPDNKKKISKKDLDLPFLDNVKQIYLPK